jgi:hypothetical protein
MDTGSSHRLHPPAADQVAVFSALREKLASEVSSCALLAELLERVASMQKAQEAPEEFKKRFCDFVLRAEEQLDVVSPFFPALLAFLPCDPAGGLGKPKLSGALEQSAGPAVIL